MNIAVFASGNGSNFKNLVELEKIGFLKVTISILVCDRKCAAMDIAKDFAKETFLIENKNDYEILSNKLDEKKIDLIVLAGFLSKIPSKIVKKYKGKIINIHPALLPAFGGKGFYGDKVFKKVLDAGVKLSGITIHFVDENYDTGPIILQKNILINQSDTIQTIDQKTHKLEHFYYPFVINMFSQNLIELKGSKVLIKPYKSDKMEYALMSLTDKDRAIDFAKKLNENGIVIISTSKTYNLLIQNNIKAYPIEALTGFDEILDGRVKTLSNIVFSSILSTKKEEHIKHITEYFIPKIDLVVVNLYDFKTASQNYNTFNDKLIENIDIGGVSLIRAAAKNYKDTVIICDKNDYDKVIEELNEKKDISIQTREQLAIKAFKETYNYDKMIYQKLSDNEKINLELNKIFDLRYGENPHQRAAVYSTKENLPFKQLWGSELSYNNLLDAYASWQAVLDFKSPCCVIFKHATPCAIAIDSDINTAFEKAYSCDPLSAFGGAIAINRKITQEIAQFLSNKFIEIISAPDYEEKAIDIFKKKKKLRILKWESDIRNTKSYRSLGNEFLVTDNDNIVLGNKWEVVSGDITEVEKKALIFAFTCVKHIKSNAIVLTTLDQTVGIGAGQMSRIDAMIMAEYKYREYLKNNKKPEFLVMASDAFFPFSDSIIKAKEIGVSAIIQPGGSLRDEEIINKAKELGIKMVLTGVRHFRH